MTKSIYFGTLKKKVHFTKGGVVMIGMIGKPLKGKPRLEEFEQLLNSYNKEMGLPPENGVVQFARGNLVNMANEKEWMGLPNEVLVAIACVLGRIKVYNLIAEHISSSLNGSVPTQTEETVKQACMTVTKEALEASASWLGIIAKP